MLYRSPNFILKALATGDGRTTCHCSRVSSGIWRILQSHLEKKLFQNMLKNTQDVYLLKIQLKVHLMLMRFPRDGNNEAVRGVEDIQERVSLVSVLKAPSDEINPEDKEDSPGGDPLPTVNNVFVVPKVIWDPGEEGLGQEVILLFLKAGNEGMEEGNTPPDTFGAWGELTVREERRMGSSLARRE